MVLYSALILFMGIGNLQAACPQLPEGSVFFYDASCNLKIGGNINVESVTLAKGGDSIQLSTSGFDQTIKNIKFSSNVIIMGDLEVHSSKQKAIYLPQDRIHLSTDTNQNTAPGQMFSKQVKTSTLTFSGSAMFWEKNGINVATYTVTGIDLGEGNIISSNVTSGNINASNVKGKIQLDNSGSGDPPLAACNADTIGTFYEDTASPKLYYCRNDQTWGRVTMTALP